MPNEHDFIRVFTRHRPALFEAHCLPFIKEMDELVKEFKAGLPTPDLPASPEITSKLADLTEEADKAAIKPNQNLKI